MATGTNGIATVGDINGKCKGSFFNWTTSKCPTKQDLDKVAWLSISGSYSDNQLVKYSDISINNTISITFVITENITGNAGTSFVEVLYGTNSTDGTQNTTSATGGKVSISGTNSSQTKTVTCTFPTSDIGSKQYYVTFKCGELGTGREWRFKTNFDSDWVDNGRTGKTFYSKPYPLQATSSTSQSIYGGYNNSGIHTVYLHIYNE